VYERKNLTKKTRNKPIEFIPLPFINNERFRPQGSGTNVQWALFFIGGNVRQEQQVLFQA
jgi:hypothetical protein